MSGGGFNLDNYNTVPERMTEAFAKYPTASLQSEIVELPTAYADKYLAVKARFFRTPDDPSPGEGMAWELVPGKTPYTKDSELMNAETSAWGRAIVAAFAADARKGIASREEMQTRQPRPRQNTTKSSTSPPAGVNQETGEVDMEAKQWEARQKLRLVEGLGGADRAKQEWGKITSTVGDPTKNRDQVEEEIGLILAGVLPEQGVLT